MAVAYIDCSVVERIDPLHAERAVVVVDAPGGVMCVVAGGVAGSQPAPRAEIVVALWVAEGGGQIICVYRLQACLQWCG